MSINQDTNQQNIIAKEGAKSVIQNRTQKPENKNQILNNNKNIEDNPDQKQIHGNLQYKSVNTKPQPHFNSKQNQVINKNIPVNNIKYNAKSYVEKKEAHFIDPKTGKKIINENNDNVEEKYKNKTFTPNARIDSKIYKEVPSNMPQQPLVKTENNNKIPNTVQNIEQETVSPVLENFDMNATITPTDINLINEIDETSKKEKKNISASTLSVSVLSNLPYKAYPEAKCSISALGMIAGFGVNSYNGKVKNFNEDRIRVIASHICQSRKNPSIQHNVGYFGIFDGHGGNKCSEFLKRNFFEYLINSQFFPDEPIRAIYEAFKMAESQFFRQAYDPNTKILFDKSGSCALIILIIDRLLYSINLGDSRALYSYGSGKYLLQITRDHKPNDPVEKSRIEKCGASVYYANKVHRNGKEIVLKEENFGKDFTFPYRVSPSGLAVARTIGDYYAKLPELGGVKGSVIGDPCINVLKADERSDFLLMGCDGIFDRLDNDKIFKKIWEYKKQGKIINDIHKFCGQVTDGIIKYSMAKDSVDNVSVIFVAFKNFENIMKVPNFVYTLNNKVEELKKDKYDFSLMK